MKRRKDNTWLIIAAIYVAAILLSIGITAMLVKIVCWAFGIPFMWRYTIGIWAVIGLLGSIFKNGGKS